MLISFIERSIRLYEAMAEGEARGYGFNPKRVKWDINKLKEFLKAAKQL